MDPDHTGKPTRNISLTLDFVFLAGFPEKITSHSCMGDSSPPSFTHSEFSDCTAWSVRAEPAQTTCLHLFTGEHARELPTGSVRQETAQLSKLSSRGVSQQCKDTRAQYLPA